MRIYGHISEVTVISVIIFWIRNPNIAPVAPPYVPEMKVGEPRGSKALSNETSFEKSPSKTKLTARSSKDLLVMVSLPSRKCLHHCVVCSSGSPILWRSPNDMKERYPAQQSLSSPLINSTSWDLLKSQSAQMTTSLGTFPKRFRTLFADRAEKAHQNALNLWDAIIHVSPTWPSYQAPRKQQSQDDEFDNGNDSKTSSSSG